MADAQTIKVSGYHNAASESVSTDMIKKTILGSRMRFPKPVEAYDVLNFFGSNIVTLEFDEWRQHRKVAAPAFGEVRGHRYRSTEFHLKIVCRKTTGLLSKLR